MVTTGFRAAIASRLRKEAAASRRATDTYDKGLNATHTEQVADHVEGLDLRDDHLGHLFDTACRLGDSDHWTPGNAQFAAIATWGVGQRQLPTLEDSVKALVRAGQEDIIEWFEQRQRNTQNENAQFQQEIHRLGAYETRYRDKEQENDQLRAELATAHQERQDAIEERDFLKRLVLPEHEQQLAKAPQPHKDPPRRQRVPDEPNIYSSQKASGETAYEIGYTDEGHQRWTKVGPDLAEAIRLRDELIDQGKISRRARPAAKA